MSRIALPLLASLIACTRGPAPPDPPPAPAAPAAASESPVVASESPVVAPAVADVADVDPPDDHHRLHPAEGTLAIAEPAAVRTHEPARATLTLTAAAGLRVNREFPIRLALVPPAGIALAHEAALTAADARELDDRHLVLAVELTATEPGSYAVTGSFKFALCQRDQCFAKDEPIAIHVGAR